MKRSLKLSGPLFTAAALMLVFTGLANAQSPTIATDKDDYVPGEVVHISGSGWLPGEAVQMILLEDTQTHDVEMLMATADSSGSFVNEEFSPEEHDLGVTFTLVATGLTSGWTAQTTFTDGPKVGSVSVDAQSPAQLCPGASATYTVTVNRGTGPGSSGNFTAALSVTTALPAGVSASFSPNSLSFPPTQTSGVATLTLTSSSSTATGANSFTVRAATSAFDFAEGGGTLTVDTAPPIASAPATKTIDVGPGCQVAIPDLRSTVIASDNCTSAGSLVITQAPAAGTMVGLGGTAVTFTVRDLLGNTASATTNVTVVDHSPPTVSLLGANPMTLEAGTSYVEPGSSASDECAGSLSVTVSGSVNTIEPGTYTLTYSANDGHGNAASATRTIHVVDTTPPVLTLSGPAPMTVECHTSFSDPGATANDLSAGDVSSAIVATGSVDANTVGSYTVSYSVSDGHGNWASLTRTVNVVDTTPPTVSLSGLATMTVECHSSFSDPGATAGDLCAGDLSGAVQVSGSVDANTVGSYTLSYSVNDGHGNSNSQTRTVNVVDTTPPSLSLSGLATMTVECHSIFSDPGATASDLCAGDLSGAVQVSGSVDANTVGSYTLSYSVNDGHGHTANASRTVEVVDTTPPSLNLSGLATMTVECHSSFSDPGATASDLCAGDLSGTVQVSGAIDANTIGSYTLSYSVNDGHGHTANASRTVEVVDTTPPSLSLSGLATMTVECHSSFSDPGATASDACAGDLSGAVQVSGAVDANTVGSYTLSYSVSDGHGHTASASRTVEVVDTTPPSLSLSGLATMTVECHSSFSDPGATASDLCAGDLSGAVQVSGAVDANTVGSYTLSYSVSDGHGHTASASRTVEVVDTTPPSLSLSGLATMTVECHSSFSDPGATASDLCAGDLSGTVQVSGAVDANTVGSYTLSYSVSDGHGHTASASRTVEVVDTTPPGLSLPPAIRVSTGTSATICGALVSETALGSASASDLCAGPVQVQRTGVPQGGIFPVGTTEVSYGVCDPSGNKVTGTQTVTVVDETPPAITPPSDMVQLVDPGKCTAVVLYTLTVSDNCPGATYVATPTSGTAFAVGVATPVQVVATDAAGNISKCSFNVTVTNPAPVVTITGPPSGSVIAVGTPITFTGSFTDNAGDTHTAQWQMDGQAMSGNVNEAAGTVSVTRAFSTAGVYTVTLSVTDQCGGVGTASDLSGLSAMVVVYDPNGGFVTGGGWIQSPAGAYRPDTTLTGKANFGFVSKYKKGMSTPTGETEFQFKAGNLNFHSTAYEWLVVSGSRAQYKGTGTVNGAGDYGFMLSAVDGQVSGGGGADRFRVKVWSRASGEIVYDNQFGNADSSAATTALGGGSIVITSSSGAGKASAMAAGGTDDMSIKPIFALAPAAPNPFRVATTLRFSLGERSRVTVAVFDAAGREVSRPLDGEADPGPHTIAWAGTTRAGSTLRSGVYFVRIVAIPTSGGERFVKNQTIVLAR